MEDNFKNTPPELQDIANEAANKLLPRESHELYIATYKAFDKWRIEKKAGISENVLLAYFTEISEKYKATSLWSKYSMLKSTLKLYHQVNISSYSTVLALLKRKSEIDKPKKSKVLSEENIRNFMNIAPDDIFLETKVVMIFGIMGALRTAEIVNIKVTDIEDHNKLYLVRIPVTKTKVEKSFTIHDKYYDMVKYYASLRPKNVPHQRFFLNFHNGKCTTQPIGKNKVSSMAKKIAKFLELPDPELYTGHSFRRTSTTLLANSGADITTIKRHGAWKSDKVAEGYIEDSITSKKKIGNQIMSSINSDIVGTSSKDSPKSVTSNVKNEPPRKKFKFIPKTRVLCSPLRIPVYSDEENETHTSMVDYNIQESTSPANFIANESTQSVNCVEVDNCNDNYVDNIAGNYIMEEIVDIPRLAGLPNAFNFNNCSVTININK